MNANETGAIIRSRREELGMTQAALAQRLMVTDKCVSKWETGRGWPDVTLLAPLAEALGLSVTELLNGHTVANTNRSFNMLRTLFYMCPVCGNVIAATGSAVVSCCGLTLVPLEAEEPDEIHAIRCEVSDSEYYVTMAHEMSKEHHISFLAAVSDQGVQMVKLYPEGAAEARFAIPRTRWLYACCNRHGLVRMRVAR